MLLFFVCQNTYSSVSSLLSNSFSFHKVAGASQCGGAARLDRGGWGGSQGNPVTDRSRDRSTEEGARFAQGGRHNQRLPSQWSLKEWQKKESPPYARGAQADCRGAETALG